MGSPAQLGYRRYPRPWRRGPPRLPRSLWRSLMDAAIFIAAAVLILIGVHIFNQATVMPGGVDVIDGDSFRRGKDEIAPEYRQICRDEKGRDWNCGREAARTLRGLVSGLSVGCTGLGADRYGRLLARCTVGDLELNSEMVRLGWAVAYTRHGSPGMLYLSEEAEARHDKRGIWRGTFDLPEDWRAIHRSDLSE